MVRVTLTIRSSSTSTYGTGTRSSINSIMIIASRGPLPQPLQPLPPLLDGISDHVEVVMALPIMSQIWDPIFRITNLGSNRF